MKYEGVVYSPLSESVGWSFRESGCENFSIDKTESFSYTEWGRKNESKIRGDVCVGVGPERSVGSRALGK